MTLSTSKILFALAMCLVVGMANCSGQSRRDIKEAKARYLADTVKDLRGIDSLYYKGLIAIHHDKWGSYTIRNNRKHYLPKSEPFKN